MFLALGSVCDTGGIRAPEAGDRLHRAGDHGTSGDGPVGNGLYIAPGPGEPGELVLPPAQIHCPTPMAQTHLIWASNDTIIVRNQHQVALIVLERR